MNINTFFRSTLIFLILLLCSAIILPQNVSAAQKDVKDTAIEFSAEEQAFIDNTDEITIGCPINNCPLLFQDEKTGQLEGITIDILDIISESTGLNFHYVALPSGSVTYQDLQSMQLDMVASVESNDINKISLGIAMTDPYLHAEKVFVCKKGVIFDPDNTMTIAVNSGSQTLAKIIRQQYPQFEVLFFNSTEDALSSLLSGEADAVLQNQYAVERVLSKPIYEDLQIVATASIGDSHCLGCMIPISEDKQNIISEDTTLLLSVLNKGIAALDQAQVSFIIIKETSENAYQFTIGDMIYRYRFTIIVLIISLLLIIFLLHRNRILNKKHSEQLAAQQRAQELAVINERMKEQQLLLMDSLERAEEGNRSKTAFLFNMSHDIRTPMNAILGFTEIAQRNKKDEARLTDCLEKIQASGKHLLHLINNVLDMSKIENGKLTLSEDHCDLEERVEKVRDILQTEVDKKHLIFDVDASNVKNKLVFCDILRLDQILFNVLSNAVKFSKPHGRILLTLIQKPCDIREYAVYEIRVKDTGIGMSPEFLSHIFEPFERERTSTVSRTQGTGLGMSITKNIVDLMGGTIEVSSQLDKGTEFILHFTFKLQGQEHQEKQQPAAVATFSEEFSGKRILLVEDNELNMEIARDLLCEVGFLVEHAENGQICVDMIRNSKAGYYDAVLMDIQMPVMDGYQASREIRDLDDKNLAGIPIIALTANAFDEDKKEALANGMNAHIAKPVDAGILYETLRNILSDR